MPGIPAALEREVGAMLVEALTRVGFAWAVALAALAVLMHVAA